LYPVTVLQALQCWCLQMWSFDSSTFLLVRTVVENIFGGHCL